MNKDNTPKTKKTNSPANKKVFDVMKPGKAPASPTSRPVIVGHKKVKEDMFVAGAAHRSQAENYDENHELMNHGEVAAVAGQAVSDNKGPKNETVADQTKMQQSVSEEKPAVSEDETIKSAPEVPEAAVKANAKADGPTAEDGDLESILSQFHAQYADDHKDDNEASVEKNTDEPKSEIKSDVVDDSAAATYAVHDAAELHDEEDRTDDGFPERAAQKPFTPDDVVAATGAPTLDRAFVSHHKTKSKWWEWVLIFLLIIILGLVALNFLLDAEVISLDKAIPHTNLIK